MSNAERVQKILSRMGVASRRRAEELILEGAVTVNGQTVKLGDRAVMGQDAIKVNGKLLVHAPTPAYYAFYKPRQVICAMEDNEGRPTLAEYLDRIKTRVYPVGRMDFNSEGLLLLTNDGEIMEQIQKHPDIVRVYHVKVKGHPNEEMIDRLRRGAKIEEPHPKLLKPFRVRVLDKYQQKALIEIIVRGSGAFDVKALCETRGFLVERITRFAIGQVTLKDLKPGEFVALERSQLEAIVSQTELTLSRLESAYEKQREKDALKSGRARATSSEKRISIRPRTPSAGGARKTSKSGPRNRKPTAKNAPRKKSASPGRIRPKRSES